ncbi:major royal jelly protein [Stagonosporopsis vannaccii]|nr:major royal jelly protein [Stagonosporopsis vannaccii]
MLSNLIITVGALLPTLLSAQVVSDPGAAGGPLELVHLYNDQWPTGITVSRTSRKFSNYPAGLDSNNTNTGNVTRYAVAELTSNNTEIPYPNAEINNPPGGAINYTTTPPTSANYQNYLIGVQSVVLDPLDRLWILDTGRVQTADGTLLNASPGGTKLVCVDITTDSVIQTIVFPSTVAFPDSYVNDVRFDLRASLTTSGKGVAYITDSSSEGRNGIIIVDLGTGESWRHLNNIPEVSAERGFVPFVWGQPLYYIPGPGMPLTTVPLGSDGIALSADGEELYFGPVGGRGLFSVPTTRLRDRSQASELLAQGAVQNRGQRGVSDGFETDTNGFIYAGNMEQNQLSFFNPANGTISTLVRDPRISWIDTLSVASDGYLYFTDNQLAFSKSFLPGTDRRVRPFALFRVKLPMNGTRTDLQ